MCVPLSLSIPCSLNGRLPRRNCSVYQADRQTKFAEASRITGEEFLSFLHYYAKAWLPARDVVKAAMEKRFDVDASGQIVVFHQVRPSPTSTSLHLPASSIHPSTCQVYRLPTHTSKAKALRVLPMERPSLHSRTRPSFPFRQADPIRPVPRIRSARRQMAYPMRPPIDRQL